MKLLFISIRILIYQFPSGICWLKAAPYASRAECQVFAAAVYIYMTLPQFDSTFLFSFSGSFYPSCVIAQWSQGCLRPMSAWPSWYALNMSYCDISIWSQIAQIAVCLLVGNLRRTTWMRRDRGQQLCREA